MARLPPELHHAGVYATSRELDFPSQRNEEEIAEILSGLSAYDCMGMIGRLSAWYDSTPRASLPPEQAVVAQWLAGWDPQWRERLRGALQRGAIVVFPQQLAHLARLVARYADPRPPEEFADREAQRDFLTCLFGVADLFSDAEVDLRDRDDRLGSLRLYSLATLSRGGWGTRKQVELSAPERTADDRAGGDAGAEDRRRARHRVRGELAVHRWVVSGAVVGAVTVMVVGTLALGGPRARHRRE